MPFAKAAERLSSARRAQTPLTECNARAIWLWFTRVTGETDQALTLIERLLQTPGATLRAEFYNGGITQAELRLRWQWDPLRSNPRFQNYSPDRSQDDLLATPCL